MTRLKNWIKNNRVEFVILLIVLIVGAFLRLYKIGQYMTFLGDEGRDATIVRNLLVHGDLILIGPGTSIGNMYLGPLYYYLMAPFLLLSNFNPVGPSVMVSILGVATIFLLWLLLREFINRGKGSSLTFIPLLIVLLYAISPVVIIYSRSSWNPNIMPFFALLTMYSLWKVFFEKEFKWLIVIGISMAFVLQSHYLGLLLVPTIGIFVFRTFANLKSVKNSKLEIRNLIQKLFYCILVFVLLMSPLLLFDLRHNFMNFNALKLFLTERQTTVSARPWTALPNIWPLFVQFCERIIGGKDPWVGKIIAFTILDGTILTFVKLKKFDTRFKNAFLLLVSWMAFSLVGFGLYKQHIYDHYFGFIFPAGFILLGLVFYSFIKLFGKTGTIAVIMVSFVIIYSHLNESPLRFSPNNQYKRAERISAKIVEISEGKDFNFAVNAKGNYETGYTYIFDLWNTPYKKILADDPNTFSDQLLVVCELSEKECNDTPNNSKTEIANFGRSTIVASWKTDGVIIQKLIHAM